MKTFGKAWLISLLVLSFFCMTGAGWILAAEEPDHDAREFPRGLESYGDSDLQSISAILKNRINQEPFNLVATLIFFCAIVHTFLTGRFMAIAHKWEHKHDQKIKKKSCR